MIMRSKLSSWFFATGDGTSLCILRKLIAIISLVKLISLTPYVTKWFTNEGWLSQQVAFFDPGREYFFSFLRWLPDPFVYLLVALLFLFSFGMLFDWHPKISNIILFLGMLSLDNRDPYVCNGFDRLLRLLLFYLAFADDEVGKKKIVELWPQRMIQIQISVMYLSTVSFKILCSSAWRNGYAVRLALNWHQYRWIPAPEIFMNSALPEILNYVTLAVEFLMGTLVFWKPAAKPMLAFGILIHLGISAFISIPLFNLTVILAYVAFLDTDDCRRLGQMLKFRIHFRRVSTVGLSIVALPLLLTSCSFRPDPNRLSFELFNAAKYGHTGLVKYLMKQGAIPNYRDGFNDTITIAGAGGHWDTVNLILQNGAKLNSVDGSGNTLLHIASFQGNVAAMKDLVHWGIPVNSKNGSGSTPLHLASDGNRVDAAKWLLANGANINAQNNYLETALHVAAWKGNADVIKLLVNSGASLKTVAKNKESIRDYLVKRNHAQLVDLLRRSG